MVRPEQEVGEDYMGRPDSVGLYLQGIKRHQCYQRYQCTIVLVAVVMVRCIAPHP